MDNSVSVIFAHVTGKLFSCSVAKLHKAAHKECSSIAAYSA